MLAVPGQVGLVSGRDGDGLLPAQFSLGCLAEAGGKPWLTSLVEGDQAAIKGGIPEGGEQQAVMHVQPGGVRPAMFPGNDVGSPQQVWIADAGEGAAALPVLHEAGAENVLTDALNHQPLGLSCAGQATNLSRKLLQRRIGEAGGEGIDPWQHSIEGAKVGEAVAGQTRAGHGGGGEANGLNDSAMIQGQEPRPVVSSGGQGQGPRNGGGGESDPALAG